MPVIGSGILGNESRSVVAGIVARYLESLSARQGKYDLALTIRRNDLARSFTCPSAIKRYVRQISSFYGS